MTPKNSDQIDKIFESFVYTGLSDDEKRQVQEATQGLQQRLTDAGDMIKGLLADREGREALAKALREGRRDV